MKDTEFANTMELKEICGEIAQQCHKCPTRPTSKLNTNPNMYNKLKAYINKQITTKILKLHTVAIIYRALLKSFAQRLVNQLRIWC